MTDADSLRDQVLSVSVVSNLVRELLESQFPSIAVQGEVTGLKTAASGHVYFSLTERVGSQTFALDCVAFRFTHAARSAALQNGRCVVATGRITSWAGGGGSRYQLAVQEVREAGAGDLLRRLEELKQRLAAEGLFDAARKRPIPAWPRRIGVVTSLQGAAIRDIVRTVLNRFPARILIAPALVQGEGAAAQIAAGIEALNHVPDVEVIIVGRGGGSMEDLWAFNEEVVVRAVAASRVPVISAVGHEIDHVLSDEAADLRAATPTAAGQAVVPDLREVLASLDAFETRLHDAAMRSVEAAGRRLDDAEAALQRMRTRVLEDRSRRLEHLAIRLASRHPRRSMEDRLRHFNLAAQRLRAAGRRLLEPARHRLETLAVRLRPLDPFAPLERGYALVRTPEGTLVRSHADTAAGAMLDVWLAQGALDCVVTGVRADRNGR